MKRRLAVLAACAAAGAVLLGTAPAQAWDCIRVSGSMQGLQNSTRSGNWEYLTIDDLVAGAMEEGMITSQAQADCVLAAWAAAGEPSYFAIGTGVAGARGAMRSGHISDADFFELAKNAPANVMVDGHGVDHLDDALAQIAGPCLG